MKMNIYCGFYRNTILKKRVKIINDIVYEIDCLECNGTGKWDFGPIENNGECVDCKGTGKQYLGM